MDSELLEAEEIYREHILDLYKHPHNSGKLSSYSFRRRELNPVCGDQIELFVRMDDNKIAEAAFIGHGCAISQASASLLTDFIKGKSVDELKQITRENILSMLGIALGPVRMKCALLALKTLLKGIEDYEAGN
ncbi:SUF system NifU family Fe-S cluster assembly protein [Candidatus Woesearchaeota archaeon]|nr:SUF system NifU family Fe-S cluster assembly protein [Candidatus Woesearchaeota archaeon]